MKILHVITRLVRGGAQINTLLSARHQFCSGHDVWLVAGTETGAEGSLWSQAEQDGYRIERLPELVREVDPVRDLVALWKLYRLLRREKFDVVHTHTSKAGLLGRCAAFLAQTGAVVVHTPHGHVFHSYFHPWKEKLFCLLERHASSYCHKIVALSTGCLDDHVRYRIARADQLTIIPSGVELAPFRDPVAVAPELLDLKGPVIGVVARLVPIKGILDILEAFTQVLSQFPTAKLILIGDGPLRGEVERRVAVQRLESAVVLVGEVEDVRPYYRGLDILALPSHNEGMGRVLVEAMAIGLPLVATRVGGVPDLVIDQWNGFLVSPRSPDELAEALNQLCGSASLREQMKQRGSSHAEHFSAEKMCIELEKLYTDLVCKVRSRTT